MSLSLSGIHVSRPPSDGIKIQLSLEKYFDMGVESCIGPGNPILLTLPMGYVRIRL